MSTESVKKLLPYQVPHALQLYEALLTQNCVLDASDTGTGKTYVTVAVCNLLKLKPFIICPKSVINNWISVAKELNVSIMGLSNYEKLKGCKYYTENLEMSTCPFIDKITNGKKNDYVFQLPSDTIVIFDEAHRCKNHQTSTSRLLLSAKDSGRKILLLSATITDKIDCFRPFGVAFDLYKDVKSYKIWLRRQIQMKKIEIGKLKQENMSDDEIVLKIIHNTIFPRRGSRMKITELGDLFPKNQIVAKCYYSDDHEQVDKLYRELNEALEDLSDKEKRSHALGQIIRCRMRIEMLKVPILIDLIEDALENEYSVAVFVNYKDTMNYIAHHLECDCLIHGDQTMEERQNCIDDFQNNKSHVIICIMQAGGVGISLHDLNGRPRMSIISPSWSGTDLKQALGRINRAGAKSPAIQRICYIAKTYEEKICHIISEKLLTLSAINDGDMIGQAIPTEKLKAIDDTTEPKEKIIETTPAEKLKAIIDGEKPKKVIKTPKHGKKKYVVIENNDVCNLNAANIKNYDKLKYMDSEPVGKLDEKYKTKK